MPSSNSYRSAQGQYKCSIFRKEKKILSLYLEQNDKCFKNRLRVPTFSKSKNTVWSREKFCFCVSKCFMFFQKI